MCLFCSAVPMTIAVDDYAYAKHVELGRVDGVRIFMLTDDDERTA